MKAIFTRSIVGSDKVVADDKDGNRCTTERQPSMSHRGSHATAALALCNKMGWTGELQGGDIAGGGMVWVWLDERNSFTA